MTAGNALYDEHAAMYAVIADDRDFAAEICRMGALDLGARARFVELFAGPAFHSRALLATGWRGEAQAIDVSAQMAALAQILGFSGEYHCTDAIDGVRQLDCADIICIPRFSIVLVDAAYVMQLFGAVRKVLRETSRFFVEIHPEAANRTGWQALAIHERQRQLNGVRLTCEWPHSVRAVPDMTNVVDMTVRVCLDDGLSPPEEHYFISREYLHSKSELIRLAEGAGMVLDPSRSFHTNAGEFLAFAAASLHAFQADVPPSLLEAALSTPFNLGSNAALEKAIQQSGLDITEHDSPLSRHVYNLL